jgi:hypothetical protein
MVVLLVGFLMAGGAMIAALRREPGLREKQPHGQPAASAAEKTQGAAPAGAAGLRDRYLQYARSAADYVWDHHDEIVARWRAAFDPNSPFGYRAPGDLIEMALIYAYLFEKEGTPQYAERARKVLLEYGDFRSQFPDWAAKKRPDYTNGVPALPDFFVVMRYLRAFDVLHRLNQLSPAEVAQIEQLIAHSMDYLMQTSEWGTMNRAMLRAESLAWAVRTLPKHPRAASWEIQRRALGDDNWGHWEIEDATIYHGVWLYSLLGYGDALGQTEELFQTPEVFYYAQYFLHLMCPGGFVPDFGDAAWTQNWQNFLVFFEAAAARLHNPQLKWAATVIADRFVDFKNPTSAGLGVMLLDAYRWGADQAAGGPPRQLSEEVMEDLQGKKIVFRNGWKVDSTYLLLNYRDEGDSGQYFRDYLRDSIPVEEEKMTHGHADENSIVLLMSGGSVLLHDGGYRDYMPSGPYGAYRQDYFHNRLCVRPEKIWMGQKVGEARYSITEAVQGQPVLEFLRDAGSYRPVRTRKVDFLSLPEFDYSRTRLIDDGWGYDWDRAVVYVKDPGLFVVFDVFKARAEEYFTLANLWHTRQIVSRGEHWYDTVYDAIGTMKLPTDQHLLVLFPKTHARLEGVEPIKRHYQDELTIYQTTAQHFELGESEAFVTVLVPHAKLQPPEEILGRIHLLETNPVRAGVAVTIESGGRITTIGLKNNLRMDMARDYRRPRYLYEQGRIAYGALETDGDFVFTTEDGRALTYTIVNMTRAERKGQVLFQGGQSFFGLAFDGSADAAGVGKVRYWRDTVKIDGSSK